MHLKWTELASADLDDIEAYIAEDNSPLVAVDVVLKILDVVELVLPSHPEGGRQGRKKGTRELVIDGIPYTVVYRIMKAYQEVQILRVLHDAQQWPHP